MKFQKMMVVMVAFLVGCLGKYVEIDKANRDIHVMDVQLLSKELPSVFSGVAATEESCLRGVERSYEALDISLGFGFDQRIRKITTRNPATRLFGINIGDSVEEARKRAFEAGFTESGQPNQFASPCCTLVLRGDESQRVFSMTVELAR